MTTRSILGKGLAALLGEQGYEGREGISPEGGDLEDIPIALIDRNPHQPRQHFSEDELESLKASVREKGILQPIILRPLIDALTQERRYQIIAGERRWRVATDLGFEKIPALVKDCTENEALELALIENIQRDNLNPLEEADSYMRLIEIYSYTQEKLAQKISKSRSYVANILRLTQLPESIKVHLREGRLSAGHARALITAENQEELAEKIITNHLSVRDSEQLAKKNPGKTKNKMAAELESAAAQFEDQQRHLADQISSLIHKPVDVRIKKDGASLTIHLYSFEEIDDFITQLKSIYSPKFEV